MLRPTKKLREKILLTGAYGTGKSHAWLSIARLSQKTGSPAVFYCIDTDDAIERMLAEGFPELENVVVRRAYQWPEYEAAMEEFLAKARPVSDEHPGDWIIVDMIDPAWDETQAHFVRQVFGKDPGDYFLAIRKQVKSGSLYQEAFDGWKDWPAINRVYFDWISPYVLRSGAHILATAQVEALDVQQEKDKTTRLLYGEYGVKPKGQKRLGHQFHTVLWLQQVRQGDWRMTTIKDRARKMLEGVPLKVFPIDYLVRVAGWRP